METEHEKLLRESSEKWGLGTARIEPVPITEVIHAPDGKSHIGLFEFNNQWGYCLHIRTKVSVFVYGPYLKFCDPCQDREAALLTAINAIAERLGKHSLTKWAYSLLQFKLF